MGANGGGIHSALELTSFSSQDGLPHTTVSARSRPCIFSTADIALASSCRFFSVCLP